MKVYAGIGSRETPPDVLRRMFEIGRQMAQAGWTLRSGAAVGADSMFEGGAKSVGGACEVFVIEPDGDPTHIVPEFDAALMRLAREHHPAWRDLGPRTRKLHARNGCQVLGLDLLWPADAVVCWTPGGLGGGGTGQAIRVAVAHGIPVYDLARFTPQFVLRKLLK